MGDELKPESSKHVAIAWVNFKIDRLTERMASKKATPFQKEWMNKDLKVLQIIKKLLAEN